MFAVSRVPRHVACLARMRSRATIRIVTDPTADGTRRSGAHRIAWATAGAVSLALGVVGIVLPLLPTTPFVLFAAFCFSRGSRRCERWLIEHPRLGPSILAWRRHRSIPLRVKQLATAMMAASSVGAWLLMPHPWRWLPGGVCIGVALWMWSLPDSPPDDTGAA